MQAEFTAEAFFIKGNWILALPLHRSNHKGSVLFGVGKRIDANESELKVSVCLIASQIRRATSGSCLQDLFKSGYCWVGDSLGFSKRLSVPVVASMDLLSSRDRLRRCFRTWAQPLRPLLFDRLIEAIFGVLVCAKCSWRRSDADMRSASLTML